MLQRLIVDDAKAWADAVQKAGGDVSAAWLTQVDSQLISPLKLAGLWPLIVDLWLHKAENLTQALVSLKRRRLGIAVNAPVFTVKLGTRFDGIASYIDTRVIPTVDGAPGLRAEDCRLAVREVAELTGNTTMMGCATPAAGTFAMRPRNAGTAAAFVATNIGTYTLHTITSLSLTAASRQGAQAFAHQDGFALVPTAPSTVFGSSLPSLLIWLGGYNNNGALMNPRAGTLAYASLTRFMTDAQESAEAQIVNAFLAAP